MAKKKSDSARMYNIDPVFQETTNPFQIYGRKAHKNEHGHYYIIVPAESVKNEKRRLSPLLTEEEYQLHLKTVQAAKEAAEEVE